MDIKTISLRSYPVVSTQKCRLALKPPSQEIPYVLPPSVSDEIIYYVEIRTSRYQPELTRQTPYSIGTDRCAIGRGTLIDIWI
jgi:hypothetical protein